MEFSGKLLSLYNTIKNFIDHEEESYENITRERERVEC